jgi:hypothetical protein
MPIDAISPHHSELTGTSWDRLNENAADSPGLAARHAAQCLANL